MRALLALSVGLIALGVCTAAYADVPVIQLSCWTDGGVPGIFFPEGTDNGDGTYRYSGTFLDPDGHWQLDLQDMLVKPDPWVNAVYGLTNFAGSTQNFTLIVSLPISPTIPGSSLMGGSTGGSVTDANFDGIGTMSTIAPAPFYMGTIDGIGQLPLLPDPFSVSVPLAGDTVNIPATSAGLPGPTIPGPPVLVDIGITHRFSLTAGDIIGITSFFVVTPEPTSLLLLGLGFLALRKR
jgi:hypothetical protein